MLGFDSPSVFQTSQCFVSYGRMDHLDPCQVPRRGQPWTAFAALDFISQVDLVLPGECFDVFQKKLAELPMDKQARKPALAYKRVVLKLAHILEGTFFTEYIKKGNILMLSKGRTTEDRVFTLREGTLTMYLDRESYERAGLVGKPHGVKGKRGSKPRWIVTCDLKHPSMLHGKRAFDRLLYACRNVLNEPLTWLFCDLAASSSSPESDPLAAHDPTTIEASPSFRRSPAVSIPPLAVPPALPQDWDRGLLEEYAADTYEWLSLVRLQSPRVLSGDTVDEYISSYAVPVGDSVVAAADSNRLSHAAMSAVGPVCVVSWEGFFAPDFVRGVLVGALLTVPAAGWFSLSATTFAKGLTGNVDEMCVLRIPGKQTEYLLWEIRSER